MQFHSYPKVVCSFRFLDVLILGQGDSKEVKMKEEEGSRKVAIKILSLPQPRVFYVQKLNMTILSLDIVQNKGENIKKIKKLYYFSCANYSVYFFKVDHQTSKSQV